MVLQVWKGYLGALTELLLAALNVPSLTTNAREDKVVRAGLCVRHVITISVARLETLSSHRGH
jgi:hypothetical protein